MGLINRVMLQLQTILQYETYKDVSLITKNNSKMHLIAEVHISY